MDGLKLIDRKWSSQGVDTRLEAEVGDRISIWGLFDAHIDNAKCDQNKLMRDIRRMADDPYSRVVIGGDFNDMMFTMGDFRRLDSGLAEFVKGVDDKVSPIIQHNIATLWPIRHKIDMVLYGNHESAYEKRANYNITAGTLNLMNTMMRYEDGEDYRPIPFHGYAGWCRYYVHVPRLSKTARSKGWLHHGAGGDAPVTKGMIGITRTQTDFPLAEWSMSGHIHKSTANDSPYLDCEGDFGNCRTVARPRVAVVCGTYEINYPLGPKSTFSTEKRHSPAPIGARRVFLYPELDSNGILRVRPDYQ